MIGSEFKIIDLSQIPAEQNEIVVTDNAPLILSAGPTEKGTESMIEISGADYRRMFGDPDEKKYGQVSTQNQQIIDAGGKLLFKRVVATDAKLANTTIVALVSDTTVPDTTNRIGGTDEEPIYATQPAKNVLYVDIMDSDVKRLSEIEVKNGVDIKKHTVDGAPISAVELANDANTSGIEGSYLVPLEEGQVAVPLDLDHTSVVVQNELGIDEDHPNLGIAIIDSKYICTSTTNEETGVVTTADDGIIELVEGSTTEYKFSEAETLDPYIAVYEAKNPEATETITTVKELFVNQYEAIPLFTVADIGRGVSKKAFQITPLNSISKSLNFMYYQLDIVEEGSILESITFTLKPDVIYSGRAIDLNMAATNLNYAQIHCYEDNIQRFVELIAPTIGFDDASEYLDQDFLFGTIRKGIPYENVVIDPDGQSLTDGTAMIESGADFNGSFGEKPALNHWDLVVDKLNRFYGFDESAAMKDGTEDFDIDVGIYDLDSYQIDAFFDYGLPIETKELVTKLAQYRCDFVQFRDHDKDGDNLSIEDIKAIRNGGFYTDSKGNSITPTRTYLAADFIQAYDKMNPYNQKQSHVTIMDDLGWKMINHIKNSVNQPYCGQRYGATFPSIIKKTINYTPRVTDNVNEKDELEDLRMNFGTYFRDTFILEDCYTSQEEHTQLSYIGNVMALQRVIKALRVKFPAVRYQYITSTDDLAGYTVSINEFLSNYANLFTELRFEYIPDSVALANKIYRAALYFRFGEFIQGERIDAYMLPSNILG